MSDIQQGPDWWLASDGKWYPPTSRPAGWYDPVGQQYAYGQAGTQARAISSTLSIWIQIVYWATAAAGVLACIAAIGALAAFDELVDRSSFAAAGDWQDANDVAIGLHGLAVVAMAAGLILTMVWMNKAHKAEARLRPGERSWSSGWAVGGWFIPVAQLMIPKLVLNEIERIANAGRDTYGLVDPYWRRLRLSLIGNLFWAGYVGVVVFINLATLRWDGTSEASDAVIRSYYSLLIGYGLAAVPFGVFGALHLRALSKRLHPHTFAPGT